MAVFRWTGLASSNFGTAANWYDVTTGMPSAVVPGQSDEALVSASGSITGNGDVLALALSGTATGLTVTGYLLGDLAYLGGTVTVAPHATLFAQELLDIGDDSANTLAAQVPTDVAVAGGGEVEVQADDANADGIVVGQGQGSGTLTVSTQGGLGGTLLSYADDGSAALTLGEGELSSGQISVTGSGSALGAFGKVQVGFGGGGGIAISDGAQLIAGADTTGNGVSLGTDGGGGGLALSAGGQGLLLGQTVVGGNGSGSLDVTGGSGLFAQSTSGAALLVSTASFGRATIPNGSLLVSDPYSFLDVSGGLDVGAGGNGVMTVENSARVVTGDSPSPTTPVLSIATSGVGTVIVSSEAELVALGAGIAVGVQGYGMLLVSADVTVTTAPSAGVSALDVGVAAGSDGLVTVADGGLILDTQAAGMIVGDSGIGVMSIGDGSGQSALVFTGDPTAAAGFSLGVAATAGGDVSITGSASGLGVYGAVADGVSGHGSIAVTDGGHLIVTNGTLANGLLLGESSGGTGALSVGDGGQVYVLGFSVIGYAGTGSLSITGGSSFTGVANGTQYTSEALGLDAALVLGLASTGVGSVLISDPATYVPLTSGLVVGESGIGSLAVTNSAILTVNGTLSNSFASVVLGDNVGSKGTLSLSGGAQMSAGGAVWVGSNGDGLLDVSNATLTINNAALDGDGGALTIANDPYNAALGIVNVAGGEIDDVRGAGVLVQGTLTISQVGSQGGTVLTGGQSGAGLEIGGFNNVQGSVSVSGSASELGVFGTTIINGTLGLASGARFATGTSVGSQALYAENGMMSLSGGAQASVLGETLVGGDYSSGTLSVTGGSGFIGQASGTLVAGTALLVSGGGAVLVSDPSTFVTLTGGLVIGNGGPGNSGEASMTVSNGAAVAVTAASAADDAASIGNDPSGDTLMVDGSGSRLIDTGLFAVGGSVAEGNAGFTISSGGTVTVAEASGQTGPAAMIGDPDALAGANSTVSVDGAGSVWTIGGTLLMSGNPTGSVTLAITDGGQVTANQVSLNDVYSGLITVSGAGSVLNAELLTVGGTTPAGTLMVESGGLINVSNGIALNGSALLSGGTLLTATTLNMSVGSDVTGTSGSSTISAGAIVDLGTIGANGGTLSCLGTITGSGLISIDGGVLILGKSEAAGVGVDYAAAGGSLVAQSAADIAGTVSGWAAGDFIDLEKVTATSEHYANGTLSLFGASSQLVGTLNFAGSLTTSNFTLSALAGGGTEIGYHT